MPPPVEILYSLPVGGIIAWCPPIATAIPPGFALCDGHIVNDPESLFNNQPTPNLLNSFIMGGATPLFPAPAGGSTSFNTSGYTAPPWVALTSPTQASSADNQLNFIIQNQSPTESWRYVLTGDDGMEDGNHHHAVTIAPPTIPAPAWLQMAFLIRIK